MDKQKVLSVISLYRSTFASLGTLPKDFPHEELLPENAADEALSHCAAMLPKMESFLEESRLHKSFRWLGFIQGVLWVTRVFSLKDLRGHSSPSE